MQRHFYEKRYTINSEKVSIIRGELREIAIFMYFACNIYF